MHGKRLTELLRIGANVPQSLLGGRIARLRSKIDPAIPGTAGQAGSIVIILDRQGYSGTGSVVQSRSSLDVEGLATNIERQLRTAFKNAGAYRVIDCISCDPTPLESCRLEIDCRVTADAAGEVASGSSKYRACARRSVPA